MSGANLELKSNVNHQDGFTHPLVQEFLGPLVTSDVAEVACRCTNTSRRLRGNPLTGAAASGDLGGLGRATGAPWFDVKRVMPFQLFGG